MNDTVLLDESGRDGPAPIRTPRGRFAWAARDGAEARREVTEVLHRRQFVGVEEILSNLSSGFVLASVDPLLRGHLPRRRWLLLWRCA